MPFKLLRRGNGYQVRSYPAFITSTIPYTRRDEGFEILGRFSSGINPMSPSIVQISKNSSSRKKYMSWPIAYTKPGEDKPTLPSKVSQKISDGQWSSIQLETRPPQVVAVLQYDDVSVQQIVERKEKELMECLVRDGFKIPSCENFTLAQYDAIYTLGKRRNEVWIPLEDHVW